MTEDGHSIRRFIGETQVQFSVIDQLVETGTASQYNLTEEEIVNVIDASQTHTADNVLQIILEERRKKQRLVFAESVKSKLCSKKSQK